MSEEENVIITGQLGRQGKAQIHHKNRRFFQPGITGEMIAILAILFERSHSDL